MLGRGQTLDGQHGNMPIIECIEHTHERGRAGKRPVTVVYAASGSPPLTIAMS